MKYNQLGRTGVLVSELCLGAMTFGGKGYWEAIGRMSEGEVIQFIKISIDRGINFIDTANAYSEGLSEILTWKGPEETWSIPAVSGYRIQGQAEDGSRGKPGGACQGCTSAIPLNDSLRRLDISHIDLLYIHGVDPLTPLEETMRGLEDVVRSGKVRYIGVSNHPAWMVMKANSIAEKMGWTRFVASQNFYSIASRDIEREIVPMALSEGMGIMPWSPLAGGFLSGKYDRNKETAGDSRRDAFDFPPMNKERAYDIIDVMERIGINHNVSVARVALAWILTKPGITSIIIGAKREEQLIDNIECTKLELGDEELRELETVSALQPEYPAWMVNRQMTGRFPEDLK